MIGAIAWQRPQLLWLTLLICALSATAWLCFDRLTTRGMSTPVRLTLFMFRTVALSLIAVALLRPILSVREPSAHRGTVAVLVDQSASMSVVDSGRSRADFVTIAAALGEIDKNLLDAKLLSLREALDSMGPALEEVNRVQGELEYARIAQRSVDAASLRLRDAQKRLDVLQQDAKRQSSAMPAAEAINRSLKSWSAASATTRPDAAAANVQAATELCQELIRRSDARLDESNPKVSRAIDALSRRTRLELVQRCLRLTLPRLDAQFTTRVFGFGGSVSNETNVDELSANLPTTDLFAAVRELRHRLAGERLSALILCSDGRQTEPLAGDPLNTAELPVYAFNPAAAGSRDLSVTSVAVPRSVFIGVPESADVTIANAPPSQNRVNVTLSCEESTQAESVRFSGPTTRVSLGFSAAEPGNLPIDGIVDPQPNEATFLNNSFRTWTRASETPSRIAFLQDGDSENTKSLRDALKSDSAITLTEPLPGHELTDQLLDQDLVILADLPYAHLNEDSWQAILKLVRDRGGAVMIVSGSPSIYLDYAAHDATAALLAWSSDQSPVLRVWPGFSPTFRPVAADAEAVAELPLLDDPDLNRQAWRELPSLFHVISFPATNATAHSLMIEAQTRSPLLSLQWLGFGRVLLLGSDEIFRWNTPLLTPSRVWHRLVECATRGAYAVEDGVLALDVDSLNPVPQQTLHVRVKVRAGSRFESDENFDPPLLLVERDGRRYFSQLLPQPIDAYPIRSDVTLPNLPAGSYRLTLLWADRKISLPIQVADSFAKELANVAADPGTLANLVGTRGAVLPLEQLPGLSSRIEAATDPSPAIVRYDLWQGPYLFLSIVACFAIDWSIRQHVGLA